MERLRTSSPRFWTCLGPLVIPALNSLVALQPLALRDYSQHFEKASAAQARCATSRVVALQECSLVDKLSGAGRRNEAARRFALVSPPLLKRRTGVLRNEAGWRSRPR